MFALLLACTSAPEPKDSAPGTTDSVPIPTPTGVVVLAGGGSEGDNGDPSSWSARLYKTMLEGGDVTGDGKLRVAVLSVDEEDDWLPRYWEELGADEAFNLRVATRADATDPALEAELASVDAAFLKGGDQGEYYDRWNDSPVEAGLLALRERGGGLGGTSAGAMSMAHYAFAGGEDLISADVLEDAQTPYLDDASAGGSGIHSDFLGIVPGVVIDTHFTNRGRLGRLTGILARVVDEDAPERLCGLGLDERTGLVLRGAEAEVIGDGTVSLLDPAGAAAPVREAGRPLHWTGLGLHRLSEGFRVDLETGAIEAPAEATAVAWDGSSGSTEGAWSVEGDRLAHEERFAVVVERGPYGTHPGSDSPVLADAIAVLDAHRSEQRYADEEALFRALYDHVGHSGFWVGAGGSLERVEEGGAQVAAVRNSASQALPMAGLIVDSSGISLRALSVLPSGADAGDGSLHAAALVGLRLHVLFSPVGGEVYNTVARSVEPAAR